MSDTPQVWFDFRNAAYGGEFDLAERLLTETPSVIHLCNNLGETVLHFLAVENAIEGVSWLHARGADINTRNMFGAPVIFEVAQLEYKTLFSWFVRQGADLRATDSDGQSLFEYLLDYDKDEMAEWVRKNAT